MNATKLCGFLLFGLLLYGPLVRADIPKDYNCDIQIYRILGGSTGNSSQTLPSTSSDIVHLINETFDGVELKMDGKVLTWNGAETPPSFLVQHVATLQIVGPAKKTATLKTVTKAEYFEFKDGQWAFAVTDDPSPGAEIRIRLAPKNGQPGVLANTYEFKCWYIKERAPLPGVTALNVGKPVIMSLEFKGEWQLRPGEWSCLRTPVPSQGQLYVFLRVTEVPSKPTAPDQSPPKAK